MQMIDRNASVNKFVREKDILLPIRMALDMSLSEKEMKKISASAKYC